jgi:hypothetical protein
MGLVILSQVWRAKHARQPKDLDVTAAMGLVILSQVWRAKHARQPKDLDV